jgi:ribonuclease HII
MSPVRPTLAVERRLLRAGAWCVVGVDEVGRGSLAGPVTVGAAAVLASTRSAPQGLRDSKLLPPAQRERLAPLVAKWAAGVAVGHAWPHEIDEHGILTALRLAALRALRQFRMPVAAVLLDGSHDWLGDEDGQLPQIAGSPSVTTRIKADRDCSSVAGASVVAKVARDALLCELALADGDRYDWAANKGYSAPAHLQALAALGPTVHHRLSWQLPGVPVEAARALDPQGRRTARRLALPEQLLLLDDGGAAPYDRPVDAAALSTGGVPNRSPGA